MHREHNTSAPAQAVLSALWCQPAGGGGAGRAPQLRAQPVGERDEHGLHGAALGLRRRRGRRRARRRGRRHAVRDRARRRLRDRLARARAQRGCQQPARLLLREPVRALQQPARSAPPVSLVSPILRAAGLRERVLPPRPAGQGCESASHWTSALVGKHAPGRRKAVRQQGVGRVRPHRSRMV